MKQKLYKETSASFHKETFKNFKKTPHWISSRGEVGRIQVERMTPAGYVYFKTPTDTYRRRIHSIAQNTFKDIYDNDMHAMEAAHTYQENRRIEAERALSSSRQAIRNIEKAVDYVISYADKRDLRNNLLNTAVKAKYKYMSTYGDKGTLEWLFSEKSLYLLEYEEPLFLPIYTARTVYDIKFKEDPSLPGITFVLRDQAWHDKYVEYHAGRLTANKG